MEPSCEKDGNMRSRERGVEGEGEANGGAAAKTARDGGGAGEWGVDQGMRSRDEEGDGASAT